MFSREVKRFGQAVDRLLSMNVFTKGNMLALFQAMYVRLFDCARRDVLLVVARLLEFMLGKLKVQQVCMSEEGETRAVLYTLVLLYLSSIAQNSDLIVAYLPHLNGDCVLPALLWALHNQHCQDGEEKFVRLVEALSRSFREKWAHSQDLYFYLKEAEARYPDHVAQILTNIGRRQEGAQPGQSTAAGSVFLQEDFGDVSRVLARLESESISRQDILLNAKGILGCLLEEGHRCFGPTTLGLRTFEGNQRTIGDYARVLETVCGCNDFFEYVALDRGSMFVSQLILSMLRLEELKQGAQQGGDGQAPGSMEEAYKSMSWMLMKLLETNRFKTTFDIFQRLYQDNVALPQSDRFKLGFAKILHRCFARLAKQLHKIDEGKDLRATLAVFDQHAQLFAASDESDPFGVFKAILSELLSSKRDLLSKVLQ